jgi:hypothetical protein
MIGQRPLSGGCQCGAARYEITDSPLDLYICHCRECRKQSASAFGISVIVRRSDFRLVQGKLRHWSRPADSGRTVQCHFCAICGSRLWHGSSEHEDTISVKGGSLDEPIDLAAAVHIWTSRKMPGAIIPEHARQFPEEPD